jgi:hypothetical protein
MPSLYEWKFVWEENEANILPQDLFLKICAFNTFDALENVSQDKKTFCNMLLYNDVAFLVRKVYERIPLGS